MLNEYFEHIYCINLKKRPNRWKEVLKEFEKINCKVERFEAVDGQNFKHLAQGNIMPGDIGCIKSHINILKKMIDENIEKILVFEDDVVFEKDFNIKFKEYYEEIPENWDIVYLGGNNRKPLTKISDHIFKTTGTLTTHSYFINLKAARELYNIFLQWDYKIQVDNTFVEYQNIGNVYIFRPHLAFQAPGYSDIREGFRNYDRVLRN